MQDLREIIKQGETSLLLATLPAWWLGYVMGGGTAAQGPVRHLVVGLAVMGIICLLCSGGIRLWVAVRDITDWVRRSTRELELLAHEIAGTESGEEIEALARRGRELLGEAGGGGEIYHRPGKPVEFDHGCGADEDAGEVSP